MCESIQITPLLVFFALCIWKMKFPNSGSFYTVLSSLKNATAIYVLLQDLRHYCSQMQFDWIRSSQSDFDQNKYWSLTYGTLLALYLCLK